MPIEQAFEATNGRVLRRSENTTATFADEHGNSVKVSISTAAFNEMFSRFIGEMQEGLGDEVQQQFDIILGTLANTMSDAMGTATENVLALRKELGIRTRRAPVTANATATADATVDDELVNDLLA